MNSKKNKEVMQTGVADVINCIVQCSMPRKSAMNINLGNELKNVKTGQTIAELLPETDHKGNKIVAGLVNNKAVSLSTPVVSEGNISFLSLAHWEGERIYRKSAALLFFEAINEIAPDIEVKLGISLGDVQWLDIDAESSIVLSELAEKILAKMREYVRLDLPFRHEVWVVEEALSYFSENNRIYSQQLLETSRESNVQMVTCGKIYAMNIGPMVSKTGMLEYFDLHTAPTGFILTAGQALPSTDNYTALYSPYASIMKNHNTWLSSLGITSVGKFNEACINGEVSQLIRVTEGFHEKNICHIADKIVALGDKVRIIAISGPSSSGKSTFIKRLKVQLQVNGINPVEISLDNYYVDKEKTVRDEDGNYDFEALEALDLDLLRLHLSQIVSGHKVKTSRYDFILGKSIPEGGPEIFLGQRNVLLIEGIHGLNPGLLNGSVNPDNVFRIFIQPMTSLAFDEFSKVNPSDMRLIRRIIRDRHSRGSTPEDNIMRWPSVRRGEKKYIFPYVSLADVIFDSSLIYELSVLKVYGERYLLEVPREHPAFSTAYRLRQVIDKFVAIYPDHVPPTSIIREFIGDSGFEY